MGDEAWPMILYYIGRTELECFWIKVQIQELVHLTWVEPNSMFSESWNEVRKNYSISICVTGDGCPWYAVAVLHRFCIAALIYCAHEGLLQCVGQGAWPVMWCDVMCNLYEQQVEGSLHTCGPVHSHKLRQPPPTLPVLETPLPCLTHQGLHPVKRADDSARTMCSAVVS